MATVKLTAACSIQTGTTPTDIVTYAGVEGDVLDVPADVAALIAANGYGICDELATEAPQHEPEPEAEPEHEPEPEKPKRARSKK